MRTTIQHVVQFVLLVLALGSTTAYGVNPSFTQTAFFPTATPSFDYPLTFLKFDPAWGTLVSVEVGMEVSIAGGSLTVDNDGTGTAIVTVELGAAGNISSSAVTLLNNSLQPVVEDVTASTGNTFNLAADNGDGVGVADGTGPDGAVHTGSNDTGSQLGSINPLYWPSYIGPPNVFETFQIVAEIDPVLDSGGVSGVESASNPVSANGWVSVRYEWSVVPEPSTFGLSCIGAASLLLRRRRG